MVVRENTEGFYADRNMFMGNGEFMPTPDVALAVRKITRKGSTRIAETAFKLAMQRPRKKVTAVHKANVLRVTDGLFLECVRAVQQNYPQVEYEEQIMDAMAALLVRDASRFDVILATNAFGDILSDEASEISGSLGLAASINAGERARAGAGAARLGARHRRQGHRQSGLADRLGGDAAGLARRAAQRRQIHQGRRPDRARARPDHRQARMAHAPISAARSAPRRSASGSLRRWRGSREVAAGPIQVARPAARDVIAFEP